MSNGSTRAPMTALEGFKILSEDVLPKLIKRIVALEQSGSQSVDTEQIELHVVTRAMQEVKKSIDSSVQEARSFLLEQFDDQAKRLDELERFVEQLKEERAAKSKRLTSGKRKKKEEAKEPEQYSMLEQAEAVLNEPPVILADDVDGTNLIPQDTETTDAAYIARQIKAIAGVGIPHEDIAAKFGMSVEQVKEIVNES